MLYDMHCHLGLMLNAEEVARDAAALGLSIFDCEVSPAGYAEHAETLQLFSNVRVGAGLHPWWIRDGLCSADDAHELAKLATTERFIGEIGLDFSRKGLRDAADESKTLQVEAFRKLCSACAAHPLPNRVLSVHAVQAASCVLDMLEEFDLVKAGKGSSDSPCPEMPAVIFHWFSGTSEELARARKLGCYFSVSELMMRSRRGREYARQIPLERLLLETDAPPQLNAPYSAQEIYDSLNRSLEQLSILRNAPIKNLAASIEANSQALFL